MAPSDTVAIYKNCEGYWYLHFQRSNPKIETEIALKVSQPAQRLHDIKTHKKTNQNYPGLKTVNL